MLAFIPASSIQHPFARFEQPESDMSTYYLNLAAQHQRQAELAMVRAQQARAQALRQHQLRQLQAAYLDELRAYEQEPSFYSLFSDARPRFLSDPYGAITKRDLFAASLARQQREREAAELKRRQEQVKMQREESLDRWLESAVVGLSARQPTQPAMGDPLQRRKAVHFSPVVLVKSEMQEKPEASTSGQEQPKEAAVQVAPVVTPVTKGKHTQTRAPKATTSTPVHRVQVEEFAKQLWNALSSSRPDEEKAKILRAFGLPAPKPTDAPKSAPVPQSTKTSSKAQPKPSTKPTTPETSTATEEAPAVPTDKERNALLSSIAALEKKFDSLRTSFEFPAEIDFDASDSESDSHSVSSAASETPSLSYTATNKSLHAYENSLTNLLTKLDEVESRGFEEVRSTRKRLVRAIEAELENLDNRKVEAWLKQQEKEKKETFGEKVTVQWEPETTEASQDSNLANHEPPEEATVIENSTTTTTEVDTIPSEDSTTVPSVTRPSTPVAETVMVAEEDPEVPEHTSETEATGVSSPLIPETSEPFTEASHTAVPDEAEPQQVPATPSVEVTVAIEPQTPNNEQEGVTSAPTTPLIIVTEAPSTPTSTKRRSVTIEEVEDEDFEML